MVRAFVSWLMTLLPSNANPALALGPVDLTEKETEELQSFCLLKKKGSTSSSSGLTEYLVSGTKPSFTDQIQANKLSAWGIAEFMLCSWSKVRAV